MKKTILTLAVGVSLGVSSGMAYAEDKHDHAHDDVTVESVISSYAELVHTNYDAAYNDALKLQKATNAAASI